MMQVKVISKNKGVALVEWYTSDGTHRGYIPEQHITETGVMDELISTAIPYGIDWEYVLAQLQPASPERFAQILRKRGVWTLKDARSMPNQVLSALQEIYMLDYQVLMRMTEEYIRSIGGSFNE